MSATLGSSFQSNSIRGIFFILLILGCFTSTYFASGIASESVEESPKDHYRINCGGSEFTDQYGREWLADDGTFSLGGQVAGTSIFELTNIESTTGSTLYMDARVFSKADDTTGGKSPGYRFPVFPTGRYLVRLHFAAAAYNVSGFSALLAVFNVTVNGGLLLQDYDPFGAGGLNNTAALEFLLPVLSATSATILLAPAYSFAYVSGIELISTLQSNQTAVKAATGLEFSSGLYGALATSNLALQTMYRVNCGGPALPLDEDQFFRSWTADFLQASSEVMATNHTIKGTGRSPTWIPQTVLMTQRAGASLGDTAGLSYGFVVSPGFEYFLRLHFAEIKHSGPASAPAAAPKRSFDTLLNNNPVQQDYDILAEAGGAFTAVHADFLTTLPLLVLEVRVTLIASSSSVLPPAIAGIEVFRAVDLSKSIASTSSSPPSDNSGGRSAPAPAQVSGANRTQAEILLSFKASLGDPSVLSTWVGLPCSGPTVWKGVGCAGSDVLSLVLPGLGLLGAIPGDLGHLSTLSSIWLNDNSLSGELPKELGQLRGLSSLRLQNNSFSGPIPESLGQLANLTELALQDNDLSGPVPALLLNLSSLAPTNKAGSGAKYVPGNANLCAPFQYYDLPLCNASAVPTGRRSKGMMVVATAVGVVGGALLLLLCLLVGYFFGVYRRNGRQKIEISVPSASHLDMEETTRSWRWLLPHARRKQPLHQQASALGLSAGQNFSLLEMKRATRDFSESCLLGSGGFGKVYRGELPGGITVAIKRHVAGSGQGSHQFFMELEVLSKVRHRHLCGLIGFCQEKKEMILVYEFMPNGTLRDHICSGSTQDAMSWRQRLEIAIGAAKGVEYLHHGLQPAIIHRDLKSTNILLDSDFVPKVGDFGLSRSGPSGEETHVSTAVRGSFGYVDPDYYKWLKLTEKSDVYSFGVVLLELVAGRKVIDLELPDESNQVNLVEWSRPFLHDKMSVKIADRRLHNDFRPSSMNRVADLIVLCLQEPGNLRPGMDTVLRELEAALRLEAGEVVVPVKMDLR